MWNPSPPLLPPPATATETTDENNNMGSSDATASPSKSPVLMTPTRNNVSGTSNTAQKAVALQEAMQPQASPFRPSRQQAELEALRQRGLAKLLNKHFTETTQKLAAEKAAVDAALQDLEARKMATTGGASITSSPSRLSRSQMDDQYHKIHQMRTECKQKEKETLLLYQRYVHKFGYTGQIKPPKSPSKAPVSSSPPPSATTAPAGGVPGAAALTPVSEGTAAAPAPAGEGQMPLPTLNPHVSEIKDGEEVGILAQLSSIIETPPSPEQPLTASMAARSPNRAVVLGAYAAGNEEPQQPSVQTSLNPSAAVATTTPPPQETTDDADDLSSLISGLTSVDSATTKQILLDCELTVATFLDEERKAIQSIMDEDLHSGKALSFSTNGRRSRKSKSSQSRGQSLQSNAVFEAETMAEQMQQILRDFQQQNPAEPSAVESPDDNTLTTSLSGTSPTSRQGKVLRPFPTPHNPDEEWTVLYDETYQREYYHEKHSGKTQWHPPTMDLSRELMDPSELVPDHDASVADSSSHAASERIARYRAKRRRRRRKRIVRVLAALLVVVLCSAAAHRHYNKKDKTASGAVEQVDEAASTRALASQVVPVESVAAQEPARIREKDESVLSAWSPFPAASTSDETQSAMTSDNNKQRPKKDDKAAEDCPSDSPNQVAPMQMTDDIKGERPWGCNMPLAYVTSRNCRKLASDNPVFDASGLVNVMMQ